MSKKLSLTNTKIRVHSPQESEEIQKLAFKLGWEWEDSPNEVCYTDKSFLYFHYGATIQYGNSGIIFKNQEFHEITLSELRSMAGEGEKEEEIEFFNINTGKRKEPIILNRVHFPESDELTSLRMENEALKKERDELRSALKEMRHQVLVLLSGLDGHTDAYREEYGKSYPESPFITTAKEFIKQFDSKSLLK